MPPNFYIFNFEKFNKFKLNFIFCLVKIILKNILSEFNY